jgi:hypothetical protein
LQAVTGGKPNPRLAGGESPKSYCSAYFPKRDSNRQVQESLTSSRIKRLNLLLLPFLQNGGDLRVSLNSSPILISYGGCQDTTVLRIYFFN